MIEILGTIQTVLSLIWIVVLIYTVIKKEIVIISNEELRNLIKNARKEEEKLDTCILSCIINENFAKEVAMTAEELVAELKKRKGEPK